MSVFPGHLCKKHVVFWYTLIMHDSNARNVLLNVMKHIEKYMLPFSLRFKSPTNVKNFDLLSAILANYHTHPTSSYKILIEKNCFIKGILNHRCLKKLFHFTWWRLQCTSSKVIESLTESVFVYWSLKNSKEWIFKLIMIDCIYEDTCTIGKDMIVAFCVNQKKINSSCL